MAAWLPWLVVLMLTTHTAQSAASIQQNIPASGPSRTFVGFDDIVTRVAFKEHAKKVFKREIADDFTLDDESNSQNVSSEASSLPVNDTNDDLKLNSIEVSDRVSTENASSDEDLTEETKDTPLGNELEDAENTNAGNANPEQSTAADEETEMKAEETVPKVVTSIVEDDTEFLEDISAENIAVDTRGEARTDILGKLMAVDEGSGDNETDGEVEEIDSSGETTPVSSDNSDQIITTETETAETTDKAPEGDDTIRDEGTDIISVDIDSEETTDSPDETPIPDPVPEKEDSTTKDFQVDELIRVSPAASAILTDSETTESVAENVAEGSGEGAGVGGITDQHSSEESVENEDKTEPPQVPAGGEDPSTVQPSQTEAVPQEADDSGDTVLRKAVLPTGDGEVQKEGINELGIGFETTQAEGDSSPENSSTSSYIVLGAIMMTIVVLVAYTVVKSRRQKRTRRSGNITKVEEEDPGREMKEVDKLLAPRPNVFSAQNGGTREDDRTPLKSFKEEARPTKNGFMPENGGGGLTDVIVENVPRLSTDPKTNGKAPNDNQSEDDQDSWVKGTGEALECTKIKMYIDEDSIPKTPIVIVKRGSTTNEV